MTARADPDRAPFIVLKEKPHKPYRHSTVQDAGREAERLARASRGGQFAIYQRIGSVGAADPDGRAQGVTACPSDRAYPKEDTSDG